MDYPPFNMHGQRYYTFMPCEGVRFFALDSNNMDPQQLAWLEKELGKPGSEWKIAFFHHPLYSSGGRHGSDLALRKQLEPLFVKYGVALALSGHDHVYERIKPQQGVEYFVIGNSAKLRQGNVRPSSIAAKAFDTDESCAVMAVEGDVLTFQVISRTGATVDSGSFSRPARRIPTEVDPAAK
ncbi:MAG TPA: metallophosphoesterase [Bryobacteraceae bacterium]|nr:metallophosphoesterase [Bryobacteraceae bacterium]